MSPWSVIGLAFVVFATTNIDDICLADYWLVNHQLLGARIRQYGHVALPFVLIALGIQTLWGVRALIG